MPDMNIFDTIKSAKDKYLRVPSLEEVSTEMVARATQDALPAIQQFFSPDTLDPARTHAGCALVLEGGSFRGIFTAGVTDVLLEHHIENFTNIYASSAGAINAACFKARQIGRVMRIMLAFRDDKRMMGMSSYFKTGNITNVEFMYDKLQNEIDPLDYERFASTPEHMVATATDVAFASTDYLEVADLRRDMDAVRASAALPGFSQFVEIGGKKYLDGGMSDPVPFATALGVVGSKVVEGVPAAERALVILTRNREYKKENTMEIVYNLFSNYKDYPDFMNLLYTRAARYDAQREQLFRLEDAGLVKIIAPKDMLFNNVTVSDGQTLLETYLKGRRAAEEQLDSILAFVNGD